MAVGLQPINTGSHIEAGKMAQSNLKKSLGQHWLVDPASLNAICKAADLQTTDLVLEIGPGSGNLTKLLVSNAREVIAVELDKDLVNSLIKLAKPNLKIINQDILEFNLNDLEPGYKIVANIPYYLTSKLIRQISETTKRPSLVALLVQKEIAERISAKPGEMSILGLTCQYFWEVEKLDVITADKFDPPPKVDSQIVRLRPKVNLPLNLPKQKKLFQLIRVGFSSKRKTLVNNLSSGFGKEKSSLSEILTSLNIDPMIRAQSLSTDQWISLLDELS